jgi:AcrR family transcriptional regulator
MARIVNKEEHDQKRNEILDAAQRLTYTKGYEQMSIQDVLAEAHISKGAFYHYFDSKAALLEAIIERLADQMTVLLTPIIADPVLSAQQKLEQFFNVAARWKTDRKDYLIILVGAWYADDNALFRLKAKTAMMAFIGPLVTPIITQGVQEGVFNTPFPAQVSEILFSLLLSLGEVLVPVMLKPEVEYKDIEMMEALVGCYQDSIERILGAAPGSLPLFDTAILREWFPLSTNSKE